MTVCAAASRPATAERIATVLPVPASPLIIAMVVSLTAQATRAAARAGGGGGKCAEGPAGAGGPVQALPAEGGVVQGADRPGRGAGQGQGLLRRVSHGLLLPSLPGLPVPPGSPAPAGRGRGTGRRPGRAGPRRGCRRGRRGSRSRWGPARCGPARRGVAAWGGRAGP